MAAFEPFLLSTLRSVEQLLGLAILRAGDGLSGALPMKETEKQYYTRRGKEERAGLELRPLARVSLFTTILPISAMNERTVRPT